MLIHADILIVTDKTAVSYHGSVPDVGYIDSVSIAFLYCDPDDKIPHVNCGQSKIHVHVQKWNVN